MGRAMRIDVQSLSPTRYHPRTWDWNTARAQAERIYENYYSLPPQPAR